jgi:hypothetical protein
MAVNNLSYKPAHFGFITLGFPTPALSLGERLGERENCAPLLVQINVYRHSRGSRAEGSAE